jgi:hypothetical protein
MLRQVAILTLLLVAGPATAALASDGDATSKGATPIASAVARAASDAAPGVTPWMLSQAPRRPIALSALYGTYGTLQALDVVTTRRALGAGARELNPMMKGGNMAAMIAVKTVAGASTIYFTERLWKKNRVGAVIVMAALNGATAAIVARNHGNARR